MCCESSFGNFCCVRIKNYQIVTSSKFTVSHMSHAGARGSAIIEARKLIIKIPEYFTFREESHLTVNKRSQKDKVRRTPEYINPALIV